MMPTRESFWRCDKCGAMHASFDAAKRCETGHITTEAIEGFRRDLDKIMKEPRP